jgi:hypothetical protein
VPGGHWSVPLPAPRQYQPTGHCRVLTVAPTPQKMPAEHGAHVGELEAAEK